MKFQRELPRIHISEREEGFEIATGNILVKGLFVHPSGLARVVRLDAIGEPQGNLVVGRLHRVRAVAHVAADIDAEVTADGAGKGILGVGGAQKSAAALDDISALPNHSHNGARGLWYKNKQVNNTGELRHPGINNGVQTLRTYHVLDEAREETLASQVSVVLLHELLARGLHLASHELVALAFEALHDLADESALDAIRLDHDKGTLGVLSFSHGE